MRKLLLAALALSVLILLACAPAKPMDPELQACLDKAEPASNASAEKACEDKSGYQQKACVKSSFEAAMAAAEEACKKM